MMHHREIAGMSVSPIGLGLAALGRPGYINLGHADDLERNYQVQAMESNTHRVLQRAWDLGIRYFDVARSYGRAEEFLASWLRDHKLFDQATIGSKWGYEYTADWKVDAENHEIKNHSLELLKQQWAESKELLHPGPHLYQIHSATMESGVLKNRSVTDHLWKIKEEGTKIGFTTSGPDQALVIQQALELSRGGRLLFDTVQSTWNLLEQSAGSALDQAHKAGLGVIVKEALANGRLTAKNRDPDFEDKLYLFEFHEQQMNASTDALAIAAALNQPWADVVLSGASTIEQLESNLEAVLVPWDDQIEQDLSFLKEPGHQYWETRSRLPWN